MPPVTRRLAALLLLVLLLVLPTPALAEEIRDLRMNRTADLTVLTAAGAFWIASELDKDQLAPSRCRWCEPNGLDVATRTAFKWRDTERADDLSDVLDFAGMPVLALGGATLLASQHDLGNAPDDAIIIVQSAVAAAAMNQIVKLSVGRERPFVHYGGTGGDPHDDNLSFYSGHTTLAFALVSSTATVASMRGYRNAWVVWPVGVTLATTVAWLRIAADKHWLSDVATGAALGTATGILVPMIAHSPRVTRQGTVVLEARPPMLMATFVF